MTRKPTDDKKSQQSQKTGREERRGDFTRRKLLQAGWSAPVVSAVSIPQALAQTGPPHNDAHGDHHDSAPHEDHHDGVPHGDTPHSDTPPPHMDDHNDGHGDVPPHGDSPHGDVHGDIPHHDVPHVDRPHTDAYQDHSDVYQDHSDVPHDDHHDVPHSDCSVWDKSSYQENGIDCSSMTAGVCNDGETATCPIVWELWYAETGNPKKGRRVGGGKINNVPIASG
ncbi:MAG: hypothetical protein U9Q71_00490, partial [Pseudomonadota bacterium]|nr:hypothetical protein [Pseudomonadota bacterium]